ncbi:MAG TPA: cupin domain-containing protein [Chryseolinea sp.]|nr:cupin domain-containing protein [Chryseolinea sp.]
MKIQSLFVMVIGLALLSSCANKNPNDKPDATSINKTKEVYSILNLVKENTIIPDSVIRLLNAQHHQLKVLERRTVPGPFKPADMKYYSDYIAKVEELPVINPGPGEYVHVMEGRRHGYGNLTIGITETFPNGAPPMHSHEGEESHVLLEGEILYAFADTMFVMKGPYIVNIPEGVPHAFKNIGKQTANLVVIFPTNIWKYDVLDYFPFDSVAAKRLSKFDSFENKLTKN